MKTCEERREICLRLNEGCELDDAINSLVKSSRILASIGADHKSEIVLLLAEELCTDYVNAGRNRQLDWDDYNEIPADVYSYFTGGARKLTEEEYIVKSPMQF